MTYVLLAFIAMSGCSLQAEPVSDPHWVDCTDFRDGEKFSFHSNTVKDASIGLFGGYSVTIVDSSGRERSFDQSSQAYIKCLRRKDQP